MARHSITIDDDLYNDISEYCKMNNLAISSFCCDLLRKNFMAEKYGDIPFGQLVQEEPIKIEVPINISVSKSEEVITEKVDEEKPKKRRRL